MSNKSPSSSSASSAASVVAKKNTRLRSSVDEFRFRDVHPLIHFGTASDRYAGWIGQIYPEFWADRIISRKRRLGGQTFEERQVPIASVHDYYEHFSTLELDFTFYQPLLDGDGRRNNAHGVLSQYGAEAPDGARFILKAPQQFSARILRRGGRKPVYESNESYLDAGGFERMFLAPALEILGDRLAAVIFEQEYQRVRESPSPEQNVAELERFLTEIPHNTGMHLELRSPHLLTPPYFEMLERRGAGFVFSHWTWLPPIREQWKRCGEQFPPADGQVIARLLTPLKVSYADAYARCHPFDAVNQEIAESPGGRMMIDDTTALALRGIQQNMKVNIITNNRAFGSAPELSRAVAHRLLDFASELERG